MINNDFVKGIVVTLTMVSLMVIVGCSSNINNKATTNNVIFKIDDDVYVKSVILHKGKTDIGAEITQEIYVYCDENGKVIKNTSISFEDGSKSRNKTISVMQQP